MADLATTPVSPIGSSFESFVEEERLLQAVDEAAVKEVVAWQVAEDMKGRGLNENLAGQRHAREPQSGGLPAGPV